MRAPGTTKVVVKISGLRNAKGMVVVRLWNSKDGFPSSDEKAFRKTTVAISNGEAVAIFSNVPQGTYAVSSFHDENGNGKFDTRFPRIPTEGYAISNDVRGKLGPPPYEPARTQVTGADTAVSLSMHY